jgi:hypothetical protein
MLNLKEVEILTFQGVVDSQNLIITAHHTGGLLHEG